MLPSARIDEVMQNSFVVKLASRRHTDRQTHGWRDGWMDGRTEKWLDRQANRQTD
jgi:hypothetical protein